LYIHYRDRSVSYNVPLIMGIVNVTPDSFSDGGKNYIIDDALKSVEKMVAVGVDIVDIGGESSRPGADRISEDEEIRRVIPLIKGIKKEFDVRVSIDTTKESVAKLAVEEAAADIINDISALKGSLRMAEIVSELNVPVVLMHMKGKPKDMQNNPFYNDVVKELFSFFKERIDFSMRKGIKRNKIIIDPGIGFGKRVEDNVQILKNLKRFTELGLPLLIGLSRKSFLGKISGEINPAMRGAETITADIISVINGASILRVHDVENCIRSIKILKELVPEIDS